MLCAVVHPQPRRATPRKAEDEALAEAGAQSYLGFHLQRVNGMLSSEQARKRLMTRRRRPPQADGDVAAHGRRHPGRLGARPPRGDHRGRRPRARSTSRPTARPGRRPRRHRPTTTPPTSARVLVDRLAELAASAAAARATRCILDDPFADLDRRPSRRCSSCSRTPPGRRSSSTSPTTRTSPAGPGSRPSPAPSRSSSPQRRGASRRAIEAGPGRRRRAPRSGRGRCWQACRSA